MKAILTNIGKIFWEIAFFCILTLFEEGGDNFVLHPKVIPITSIWVKLHKNVIRYMLEIYFPSIFQQNQNYQQVTWPPYDVIMEFAINSMVKLSQNQKCCNFVKNWYIRTKFYQEVYLKDCKTSKMKFQIFWKNFQIFPDFPIFSKKWHFWVIFGQKFPIGTWIWM